MVTIHRPPGPMGMPGGHSGYGPPPGQGYGPPQGQGYGPPTGQVTPPTSQVFLIIDIQHSFQQSLFKIHHRVHS